MRTIKRIVVTYAIKEELIHLRAPDCEFFYLFTGVGKAKSAFELTRYLSTHDVDLVLNIGTAGTFNHKVGASGWPTSWWTVIMRQSVCRALNTN